MGEERPEMYNPLIPLPNLNEVSKGGSKEGSTAGREECVATLP